MKRLQTLIVIVLLVVFSASLVKARTIDYEQTADSSVDITKLKNVIDTLNTKVNNGKIDNFLVEYSSKSQNLTVRLRKENVSNSDMSNELSNLDTLVSNLNSSHSLALPTPADKKADIRKGG